MDCAHVEDRLADRMREVREKFEESIKEAERELRAELAPNADPFPPFPAMPTCLDDAKAEIWELRKYRFLAGQRMSNGLSAEAKRNEALYHEQFAATARFVRGRI